MEQGESGDRTPVFLSGKGSTGAGRVSAWMGIGEMRKDKGKRI